MTGIQIYSGGGADKIANGMNVVYKRKGEVKNDSKAFGLSQMSKQK